MLNKVARIQVELQGSLALTGLGHASDRASMLGLMGADPETLDPDEGEQMLEQLRATHRLTLPNGREIPFDPALDLEFRGDISPELHPNGMRILMRDGAGTVLPGPGVVLGRRRVHCIRTSADLAIRRRPHSRRT